MTEFDFYLFTNRYGERFICYESAGGYKIIEDFSRIPYTAESLFEDILDGFSAYEQIDDYEQWSVNYWRVKMIFDESDFHETLLNKLHNDIKIEQIAFLRFYDGCFSGELNVSRMHLNESILFRDLRNYLVDYCEANDYELYLEEERMKITQFVNSKDIRGYWEEIGYEPSALESAWLVWQGKNQTLKEKHTTYWNIIDSTKDQPIPAGFHDLPQPSLHEFLKRYTEIELQLISDFYKEEPNTVYFYREYFDDDWYEEATLFHTFEEAQAFAVTSIEVNDVDIPQPNFIEFVKTYIGEVDKKIFVRFNPEKEIVRVDENQYLTDEKDYEIFQEVFRNMWFSFPTPFKKGDVVKTVRGVYTRPSYLNGTFVLTSVCNSSDREGYFKENGDGSDMTAHGYFVDFEGVAYHECIHNYMDLEYVRDPLENEEKVLHPISKYLKGEIDLGLLLGAYRYIIVTHEANMVRMSLRYTKEGKELAGIEK